LSFGLSDATLQVSFVTVFPWHEGAQGVINELDTVVLTIDLPEDGLKAGDLGPVVAAYVWIGVS